MSIGGRRIYRKRRLSKGEEQGRLVYGKLQLFTNQGAAGKKKLLIGTGYRPRKEDYKRSFNILEERLTRPEKG